MRRRASLQVMASIILLPVILVNFFHQEMQIIPSSAGTYAISSVKADIRNPLRYLLITE